MQTFELLLRGFDGTTDTDHLVKWVNAPSLEVLTYFVDYLGIREHLERAPDEHEQSDLEFADGVDLQIDQHYETRFDFRFKNPNDSIAKWIEESKAAQAAVGS